MSTINTIYLICFHDNRSGECYQTILFKNVCFQLIHQVDYEDELDLMWISATYQSPNLRGVVCFHDNRTGDLLREVEIQEKWEEVKYISGSDLFSCFFFLFFFMFDSSGEL